MLKTKIPCSERSDRLIVSQKQSKNLEGAGHCCPHCTESFDHLLLARIRFPKMKNKNGTGIKHTAKKPKILVPQPTPML